MKLTAEQVDLIERVLTMYSQCGQRATMIEFDIANTRQLMDFVGVIRALGITVPRAKQVNGLTAGERRTLADWMARRAAQ